MYSALRGISVVAMLLLLIIWSGCSSSDQHLSQPGDGSLPSSITRLLITTPFWEFSVPPGETLPLLGTAFNADNRVILLPATTLSWQSGNPTVASIDARTGILRGITPGQTTITVVDSASATRATQVVTVGERPIPNITGTRLLFMPGLRTGTINTPLPLDVRVWNNNREETTFKARWDYTGDGRFDTPFVATSTIAYPYTQPGSYTPRVEVRGCDGQLFGISEPIDIFDAASPDLIVVNVTPSSGNTSTRFAFRVTAWDTNDSVAPSAAIRWDWENDGIYDTPFVPYEREDPNALRTFMHQFPTPGIHLVRVQREGALWSQVLIVEVLPN